MKLSGGGYCQQLAQSGWASEGEDRCGQVSGGGEVNCQKWGGEVKIWELEEFHENCSLKMQ